jgi:hypothetical protein
MSAVAMRDLERIYSQPIHLFQDAANVGMSWIMLMPEGKYHHPSYGDLDFDKEKLSEFKQSFDERVRKIDIALDVDHKAPKDDSRASGWIKEMEIRAPQGETPGGLWGLVEWTPYGTRLIQSKEYRYFSPEYGDYTDEETGKTYENVINGGALTNRPFLKVMPAVTLAESRRPWASIKKSQLPRSCFLIQGDPNDKSTWKLPVYEGTGPLKDGMFTKRGALNINGVKAAWAAINGAHTGKAMSIPASVRARLASWHKKYFETGAKSMADVKKGGLRGKTAMNPKAQKSVPDAADVEEYDPTDIDDATEFDDAEADDSETCDDAEADDAETYDDAEADEADDGDNDDDDQPVNSPRGKALRRSMAKRASTKASTKASSKAPGRKMSEGSYIIREQETETIRQLREQILETNYRLYERDVEDILRAWTAGKTIRLADATETSKLPKITEFVGGKRVQRTAKIEVTPKSRAAIKDYLLSEAFELNEESRGRLLHLIQTLLSENATVITSRLSSSFDQEQRKTVKGSYALRAPKEGDDLVGLDLQEIAETIARKDGKVLSELDQTAMLRYYTLAEKELS